MVSLWRNGQIGIAEVYLLLCAPWERQTSFLPGMIKPRSQPELLIKSTQR